MRDEAAVLDFQVLNPVLASLAVSMVVGTTLGAVMLRGAVGLANNIQFGSTPAPRVPSPRISSAALIMLVISAVTSVAGLFIGAICSVGLAAIGASTLKTYLAVSLPISVLIGLVLMATMLKLLLPTSFSRAIVVSAWYLAIGVTIGAVAGAIVAFLV